MALRVSPRACFDKRLVLMAIRHLLLLGILAIELGQAQKTRSEFDVASVKPSAPDRYNSFAIRNAPGGRVQLLGAPLRMILMEAYDMQAFQISGGPDWVRNDRWDIEAKADGTEGRLPRADRDAMLQALIADRFHLMAHQESRQMPIYTLEVNKKGPNLAEHAGPDQEFRPGPGGSLRVKKGGTVALAAWLSRQLGREVLDKTNLKGEYDYSLEWTPAPGEGGPESIGQAPSTLLGLDTPTSPTNGPSIFTALREQLGLRLGRAKRSRSDPGDRQRRKAEPQLSDYLRPTAAFALLFRQDLQAGLMRRLWIEQISDAAIERRQPSFVADRQV